MKKTILSVIAAFGICSSVFAQTRANDSVSINPGYSNQVFYDLSTSTVSSVSNTNWELAFQISGFEAAIYVNGKNNTKLFNALKDTTHWSTITAADTAGLMTPMNQCLNSDTSWRRGAFNQGVDLSNAFDLGWGVYEMNTHAVVGDSLYFLQLGNGTVKKLWMRALVGGTYLFSYANLDGSNQVDAMVNKANYTNQIFGYYSIAADSALVREPQKNTWDLAFQQYFAVTPMPYKVVGVLQNEGVLVQKVNSVDTATMSYNASNFNHLINTIGYDWKSFDMNTNSCVLADSTVYFVQDRNNTIWKVIFTGFGGSASGKIKFSKEQVLSNVGVESIAANNVFVYPTLTSNTLNVVHASNARTIHVLNQMGQAVLTANATNIMNTLDVSELTNGVYFVQVDNGTATRFIKN